MQWLIIFVQRLLGMWTFQDDPARPRLARQYAPAYAAKAPRACRYTGQTQVDRNQWYSGVDWSSLPPTRPPRAAGAQEGPPDG